jgi:phenylalanyl-tRNA synthetase beta chain
MKFSLNWLKEYLITDCGDNIIIDSLTKIGLEVESVENYAIKYKSFVIGKIESVQKHPNADKLNICMVDVGNNQVQQIVCGAPNVKPQLTVVVAMPGAIVPNGNFAIKKSKIRDIESNGMICSAQELMLGAESNGIMELPSSHIVGSNFAESFFNNDTIVEISITPNRGDCASIFGIARDLYAFGIGDLKPLAVPNISKADALVNITIEGDIEASFCGITMKQINNADSPQWLKSKIESCGITSHNAIVDISNYVMLLTGNPVHIYDADKISGDICVRRAISGEKFISLKNIEYTDLQKHNGIVVADDDKIISLLGIMGGANSCVDQNTRNILIESAYIEPKYITKMAQQTGIISEARFRTERGVNVQLVKFNAEFIASLVLDICGGNITNINHVSTVNDAIEPIIYNFNEYERIIGEKIGENCRITQQKAIEILKKLGCTVKAISGDVVEITPPAHRHDIRISADVTEEIARISDINAIPFTVPHLVNIAHVSTVNTEYNAEMQIRKLLASQGYNELITMSFTSINDAKCFTDEHSAMVPQFTPDLTIKNPISVDMCHMRPSMLPEMLKVCSVNTLNNRKNRGCFFEIGKVFFGLEEKRQRNVLCMALYGESDDILTVKNALLSVLSRVYNYDCNHLNAAISPVGHMPNFTHLARFFTIQDIAFFGEIHPKVVRQYNLDTSARVFFAQLFLEDVGNLKVKKINKKYNQNNNLPVLKDMSFKFENEKFNKLNIGKMLIGIKNANNLIMHVQSGDIFEMPNEPYTSISVTIQIQPHDAITAEDINTILNNVNDEVITYGGVLRGAI